MLVQDAWIIYTYESKVDLTALWHIFHIDQKQKGPKIDPCGTPKEIFPKSESLHSILARNIRSER